MDLEQKCIPAEFKADMDSMTVKGYGSVFGNIDSHGDRVRKGAFKETIAEKFEKSTPSKIKLFWRHFAPFGVPTVLEEDSKGLYFEGKASNTSTNRDRMELIRDGVVDGASIGFSTLEATKFADEEGEGPNHRRDLLKLNLFELGPVVWGSNDKAHAEAAKAAREIATELKSGRMLPESDMKALAEATDVLHRVLKQLQNGEPSENEGEPEQHKGDEPDPAGDEFAAFLEGEFFASLKSLNSNLARK